MSGVGDWLRERSLWQVLGVYLAGSWVAFEVVATVSDTLDFPDWVARGTLVLIAVGVPIVITAALLRRRDGPFTLRNALIAGVAALVSLIGVGALVVGVRGDRDDAGPETPILGASIAVLPAYSPNEPMMGAGLTALVSTGIDGATGWRAVSPRTVQARWAERVEGEVADEATALEVGRATGASYAVLPTVVTLPNEIRISAEVFDLSDLSRLSIVETAGHPDSLALVAGTLSVRIMNRVLRGEGEVTIDLEQLTSGSAEALQAFLEGEVRFRDYELARARDAFLRAVGIDSTFALAHYRLAEVFQWGEVADGGASNRHMRLAATHADRLGAREAGVARARTATAPGSDAAEQARLLWEVAIAHPDDPTALYWLGETLVHSPSALARTSEIDSVFQRAVDLDPGNPALYPHALHLTYIHRRDPEMARSLAQRFLAVTGEVAGPIAVDVDPRAAIPAWEFVFGDSAERRRAESWVLDSDRPRDRALGILGHIRSPVWGSEMDWLISVLGDTAYPVPQAPGPFLPNGEQTAAHYALIRDLMWRGRVEEAMPHVEALPDEPATGLGLLLEAFVAGSPIDRQYMEREFGAHRISEDMSIRRAVGAIVFAKEDGRESDADRALEILGRRASSQVESPDWWVSMQAVVAWKDGDPELALEILDQRFQGGLAGGGRAFHWAHIRMLMELERWAEAELLLAAGGWDASYTALSELPIAQFYLGRAYEMLDEPEKARAAYGYFLEHWSDPDPAAQPLVDEARSRIEALVEAG